MRLLRTVSRLSSVKNLERSFPVSTSYTVRDPRHQARSIHGSPTVRSTSPETPGTESASANMAASDQQTQTDPSKPLALPALPDSDSAPSSSSTTQTLEVNGSALRLDHMGPLVVNEDGTMSRIANWDNMADIEKENALRILGKRNKMRLEKIRAAAADKSTPVEGAHSPGDSST